ncbi:MAG: hypothetical protein QOJ00_846, partial [Actinomycetota bacterium]
MVRVTAIPISTDPRRRRRATTAAAIALVLVLVTLGASQPGRAVSPAVTELRVSGPAGAALQPNLVGFNWRAGGEAVAPLRPGLVRSFAVRLAQISPAPGVLHFGAADAEIDAISATGATPVVVLIERPPWDPAAGSPGYESVVAAVVRHYLVERGAAGHPPVWFESGNEPEFPPTSHGQLPSELAADVAAQVRAIRRVEADAKVSVSYGGPAALFADPAVAAAFIAAARAAGRLPDFVSWHTYTNAPMLGPDGPEDRSSPAAVAVWEALHGTNPAASPTVLGAGIDVMRAAVKAAMLPGEATPALLITEWNLSSGGFDARNDTYVGAAHTVASLIEMQRRGLDGATFFAAVDRHCSNPDVNPSRAQFCGDWGTASATGARKPVWHAFDLWRMLKGPTRTVTGADGASGLWALAADDAGTTRIIVASFSVATPTDRQLRIAIDAQDRPRAVVVRRVDADHSTAAPTASVLAARADSIDVALPANSVVMV